MTLVPHDDEIDDQIDDQIDDDITAALAERDEILPSTGVQKFRRNSAVGAVLNGMALGLRDVFDPVKREEPPIHQDAPGEPPNPRHVDAHLDPDDPTASSVTVRPWLADTHGDAADAEPDGKDHP